MMRIVMPIIFIGISVAVFFVFADPIYNDIKQLRVEAASYDEALSNSKALENARDVLTAKKNSMDPVNLTKIQQLQPENVKYNATDATSPTTPSPAGSIQGGGAVQLSSGKDYGVWDLEFSTTSTYNNFLSFMKDLEKNLRIVDIYSIQFSSNDVNAGNKTSLGVPSNNLPTESYTYSFKIRTYWLKN